MKEHNHNHSHGHSHGKIEESPDQIVEPNNEIERNYFEGGHKNKSTIIQEVMTAEEKLIQEKILATFKMQILNPYMSDNIYLEFNISNLI